MFSFKNDVFPLEQIVYFGFSNRVSISVSLWRDYMLQPVAHSMLGSFVFGFRWQIQFCAIRLDAQKKVKSALPLP
jgi:hypothetical protein